MTSSQGEYFVLDPILVIVPSSSFLVLEKQPNDLTLSYIAHTLTSRYSELPKNNILCYYFICRNFNANINYPSSQYFLNMNYGPFSNIKIPAYANLARGHFSKKHIFVLKRLTEPAEQGHSVTQADCMSTLLLNGKHSLGLLRIWEKNREFSR